LSTASRQTDSLHIESHEALLQQPADAGPIGLEPRRHLDAIVVPTIRPQSLGQAIALARAIGCALVVLCSTAEQATKARSECGSLDDVLVTYVSPSAAENLLPLLTSQHPQIDIATSCHVDIARKRNVGLLLARLCGWSTIMFLDDDIRDLTVSAVSAAAALAARFQAVGFKISHYPDNSVVCHAHRLAGGTQDVFPGGSALVVNVFGNDTMFPTIYNEDWLFLFDAVEWHSIALAGTLSQLEYDPFARPQRAASEEFGDVIAEGLYWLLHEGGTVLDASLAFWRSMLERRSRLIDHIASELPLRRKDGPVTDYALKSLGAARGRLAGITEQACASFVGAWRTDVDVWRKQLTDLPVLADLAGAAKYLDLPTLGRGVIRCLEAMQPGSTGPRR
jgi:hypothetical protein